MILKDAAEQLEIKLRCLVLIITAVVLSGCNETKPDALFLKESQIQSGIDKQLPINGLVNVQIHIPDDVASLSGFFAERVVSDPLVEAKIELHDIDVSLVGHELPANGRIVLLAKPIIRISLLGVNIVEPMNIELSGGLRAEEDKLYLDSITLKDNGSFFLDNFVPNEYRNQFIANLNEWFVAYFSAYPLYQVVPESELSEIEMDKTTLFIEDDLVRFLHL